MPRFPRSLLALSVCLACVEFPAPARANPAAAAAGDVVLLDFSAPWCGPCRQMAPLIGEITAAGWIVRHVDVDREGDLVRRFGVAGVPCYVLLVKGQEAGRINGATTRGELENLLAKSRQPLGLAPAAARTAPTATAGIPVPVTQAAVPLATEVPAAPLASGRALVTPDPAVPPRPPAPARPRQPLADTTAAATGPALDAAARVALEQRLLAATARLMVQDANGLSRGTGTVIDCRQGEALILTCGHIFRDSQGRGRVEVDLFGADGPRGLAGQVVAWDLKRDLALVSIFTERQIDPVRVGGTDRTTAAGEAVVTVGCNGGDDPTIHHSRITAVDKYLGPANVQVAGQPVQGRSGGGLFAIDGTLIGVCNAADPADNEGLFAALPTIHEQLDESGLAFVYRSTYPSGGLGDVAAAGFGPAVPTMPHEMPTVSFDRRDRADALPTAATALHGALPQPTTAPGSQRGLSPGEQALVDHVLRHDEKAEVICIVRPRGDAQAAGDVFVLQGTGREFVEQLAKTQGLPASRPEPAPAAGRSGVATLPSGGPSR